MIRTLALWIALGVVAPMLLVAQTAITGKWQGETPNGNQIVLEVKADGTTLTGTLSQNRDTSPISEGKMAKTTFTFKAMMEGSTEGFSGEVGKDEIRLWPDRLGADRAVVLKRAK